MGPTSAGRFRLRRGTQRSALGLAGSRDAASAALRRRSPSVERYRFVPLRDLHGEAQGLDLRGQRALRLGIAVDDEHLAREARVAGLLATAEIADPVEQLRLVGMRRKAADRPDLA